MKVSREAPSLPIFLYIRIYTKNYKCVKKGRRGIYYTLFRKARIASLKTGFTEQFHFLLKTNSPSCERPNPISKDDAVPVKPQSPTS